MKTWIKILIAGVIGFGAGFGSGFLFQKKLTDMKFVEISEEEMAEIEKKEAEKETQAADGMKNIQELPDDPDKLKNALQGKVPYEEAKETIKESYKPAFEAIVQYSDIHNAEQLPVYEEDPPPSDAEEGFDEDFLEVIEQEEIEPGQVDPPHMISLGEFYNERPEYDKITIDWYEEDNAFLDEREEIIPDIRTYTGMDVKTLFGMQSPEDDPDVRFVRNEQYGSDYEIIRHHKSWRELNGEGDEP